MLCGHVLPRHSLQFTLSRFQLAPAYLRESPVRHKACERQPQAVPLTRSDPSRWSSRGRGAVRGGRSGLLLQPAPAPSTSPTSRPQLSLPLPLPLPLPTPLGRSLWLQHQAEQRQRPSAAEARDLPRSCKGESRSELPVFRSSLPRYGVRHGCVPSARLGG